jgi:hypothetical protein
MLHGAIFLATCNAILLLRDVKLPNSSLHQGLIPRALFLGEMRNISPVSFELLAIK